MLRRAIAGHHPQWLWLSHTHPDLQSFSSTCRSFSASVAPCKQDEEPSRHEISQTRNHSSRHQEPSSSSEADDDALGEDNATNRAPSDAASPAAQPSDAPAPAPAHPTRTRTRVPRTLRPILISPAFQPPPSLLQSPHQPTSSHNDQQTQENEHDQESSAAATAATVVVLASLPQNTLKTDIRPVLQRFGEVRRILVRPDGRRAEVIFADAHAVARTLHAYAERLIHVRGREVVVFRKQTDGAVASLWHAGGSGSTPHAWAGDEQQQQDGHGKGTIFVSGFPPETTQDDLAEALGPLGKYEGLVMRPGSKYAFFVYSSDDLVDHVLRVHQRVPLVVRGRTLRVERSRNRPYGVSPEHSDNPVELGKPLDPAASSAILEELKQTVPKWRGLYEPSRVLWIGRLPTDFSKEPLTNFWSRLGCVVEVRASSNGFAHVEFATTQEALRAARQGAPHGFRYAQRLLHVDFAPWKFYISNAYRVVYVSGWPASEDRHALLRWAYDIPNIHGATVLPPFRGEGRSDPRSAYLQFRTISDARAGLHKLVGREGPGGEGMHVALSRAPAVRRDRLWRWAHAMEEGLEKIQDEEAYFEAEWEGLGFGTGTEEEEEGEEEEGEEEEELPVSRRGVDGLDVPVVLERPSRGTRGGRGHFKDWSWSRANERKRERASGLLVERSSLGKHDARFDTPHLHPLLQREPTYGEEDHAATPTAPPPFPFPAAESELEDPQKGGTVGDDSDEPFPSSTLATTTGDRDS
ncbi:hypothetical protein BC827DRAFT_1272378 [Russula dissimulans]|nr:hypothetical protein BC827DRAFT_1272378 [Russula dissimulans]